MKKMYAVKRISQGDYLNYSEKTRNWFSDKWSCYSVHSPFPTLRPKEHFKYFKKWIKNTDNPKDYIIVEFEEREQ